MDTEEFRKSYNFFNLSDEKPVDLSLIIGKKSTAKYIPILLREINSSPPNIKFESIKSSPILLSDSLELSDEDYVLLDEIHQSNYELSAIDYSREFINCLTEFASLHILKWVYLNTNDIFKKYTFDKVSAVDIAAYFNMTEKVKWLHDIANIPFTEYTLYSCIRNENMELLKYIINKNPDIFTIRNEI